VVINEERILNPTTDIAKLKCALQNAAEKNLKLDQSVQKYDAFRTASVDARDFAKDILGDISKLPLGKTNF
jgi:hypothetical protein